MAGFHTRHRWLRIALVAVIVAFLGGPAAMSDAGARSEDSSTVPARPGSMPSTIRASVAGTGVEGDKGSDWPSLSSDGQLVAFRSHATNLVADDANDQGDIFLRDLAAGTVELISVSTTGVKGNDGSLEAAMTGDGRYVAFSSSSSNLVSGDTNGASDIFVRDRELGTTERISVGNTGAQADNVAITPSISDDGRYVAFLSRASNLVVGDTNGQIDVFVRDRQLGTTERVSVATDGTEGDRASIALWMAGSGNAVAFVSRSANLVAADTNAAPDVFVRDLVADRTERVSVASGGTQANVGASPGPFDVSISADGRHVAFISPSTNLVEDTDLSGVGNVFVHDRMLDLTQLVSAATDEGSGNEHSYVPRITRDGTQVAFRSGSSNLTSGDTNGQDDVFVRDLSTDTTERASLASDGAQANDHSYSTAISDDGRWVAFDSFGSNLVADDTNETIDVFVRDRGLSSSPGRLRVTTTPAVPGHIIVDGVPRDSWGLNWVEFPAGEYEVCFGPVPGFTPPPCTTVNVDEGLTTTVDGVYTQRGTLRVLTSPALPATVTIDGQPANDWGVWTDLDPGTYEVCFGAVADFSPPPCQVANITAGNTETITGIFTASSGAPAPAGHGYLRATTDPAVASRILVDGAIADTWGLTWLKLPAGDHELCFEAVLHTNGPSCEEVEIIDGQTTIVEGAFVTHGFLRVLTDPPVGAMISIDGHPANAWGVWTSLEPGTYEVCYGAVAGLTEPPCEDAIVTAGTTTTLTGAYLE
jgi:Tol biopolymer transport system component